MIPIAYGNCIRTVSWYWRKHALDRTQVYIDVDEFKHGLSQGIGPQDEVWVDPLRIKAELKEARRIGVAVRVNDNHGLVAPIAPVRHGAEVLCWIKINANNGLVSERVSCRVGVSQGRTVIRQWSG